MCVNERVRQSKRALHVTAIFGMVATCMCRISPASLLVLNSTLLAGSQLEVHFFFSFFFFFFLNPHRTVSKADRLKLQGGGRQGEWQHPSEHDNRGMELAINQGSIYCRPLERSHKY